jgi:rhizosphere induced protein
MTQRQITLVNNSASPTSLAVLQGGSEQSGVVAWLAKYAYPNTQIRFTWDDTDLCFVWAGTGQLSPGVLIEASQVVSTSLNEGNVIDLSYDSKNRTFYFHNQQTGGQPGSLTIRQDSTVPPNAIAVGIGMSGKPTFVMQANPNMYTTFQPRPTYYLAFGAITQSEVVDTQVVQTQEIAFPPNVVALTATLGADNQWTVVSDILSTVTSDE